MNVEVDGTQIPPISNKIGWLDSVMEVAFCVTDFGEYDDFRHL